MIENINRCPDEVLEAITEILTIGISRIRNIGNESSEFYRIEAYHLHNLPHLIKKYSDDLLKYYLNIERPSYISEAHYKHFAMYESQWNKLEDYLKKKEQESK